MRKSGAFITTGVAFVSIQKNQTTLDPLRSIAQEQEQKHVRKSKSMCARTRASATKASEQDQKQVNKIKSKFKCASQRASEKRLN
jgi:hypothetical protein